jgi:superfamily I DNA/RNA helicase
MSELRYLALSQRTARWLLGKREIVDALSKTIAEGHLAGLEGEVKQFPIRIVGEGEVVVFSHAEYLTATSDEALGFIRVGGPNSIAEDRDLAPAALALAVAVIDRRLLGQLFEEKDAYFQLDDIRHAVVLSDATLYRTKLVLGWAEWAALPGVPGPRAMLLCGPGHDDVASDVAAAELRRVHELIRTARALARNRSQTSPAEHAFNQVLAAVRRSVPSSPQPRPFEVTELARRPDLTAEQIAHTERWSYDEWSDAKTSTLSVEQMHILTDDAITRHPLRLFGPAGSGKTLLMQLMAIRRLRIPRTRVLYITHNASMEARVQERFEILGCVDDITAGRLVIKTLSALAVPMLRLKPSHLIEVDPENAKEVAFQTLHEAVDEAIERNRKIVINSPSLRPLAATATSKRHLVEYVRAEIGFAIKGRGVTLERQDYTNAEGALATLHAVLTTAERNIVYDAFEHYQRRLEAYGVMDADDVALTLLNHLSAPKWKVDRPSEGFDYVFVDEAQLFNDNERRVFSLLTNLSSAHTPVAIALDDAQRLYDPPSGGTALYGLTETQRETLHIGHRLSEPIAQLAFFVIAESTTLYESGFPDYPGIVLREDEVVGKIRLPQLITSSHFAQRVIRLVKQMFREKMREIAIIAHSAPAFSLLSEKLPESEVDVSILTERGAGSISTGPSVILSQPELIGGQEFDCVISCGLEDGLVPPRVSNNVALAATLEQQALRELYLVFTRARHQLFIVNFRGRSPSPILTRAAQKRYLDILPPEA